MQDHTRQRLADLLVGGLVGGLIGAIVAVNVVIYSGIEQGYQASLPEVFGYNPVIGVVVVVILIAGPVLGAVSARRLRSRRRSGG
ncbi:MAG TPA: hypothetical protein VLB67_02880 [Acidimicrobiia bacterium]|nr:hypothetical protein [Acidimicrobiia bacterium]